MKILKPNDILIATLNNPELTPYDMLSNNINGENTSFFSKDEYKSSEYIQEAFKGEDGKFDDISFEKAYNLAKNNFFQLTNQEYIKSLDEISYSPFDVTRPKFANTINVSASFEKEVNPFQERKGWTGIGSIDSSSLSLRELAQQSKIFDPQTNTWSEESLNDLSLLDKFFGETLVYAQYDDDGQHLDEDTGLMLNHKKGDWKVSNGNLFIEKLGNREIYGRQVVNPMDTLTTDGSLMNQFDFLDSDGREKSITGTVLKTAVQIAPLLIPSFGAFTGATSIPSLYGGVRAAIGLSAAMPTLYKSLEGLLLGEKNSTLTKGATELEGWMAKFTETSVSDAGSESLFGVEQMTGMVSSIFSQIYEQRAAASLSRLIYKGDKLMTAETQKMANSINQQLLSEAIQGKIKFDDIGKMSRAAMEKIPALKTVIDKQSQMSKALSLGYMAITSTSDIYGQAIQGGYDRRTAGFAALAAAAGQYGVMMNNRMGTWFLDKTTGYSEETNRALIRKGVLPWLDEVEAGFKKTTRNVVEGKKELAGTFGKIKNSLNNLFYTPSVIGEAMWKNAIVEGVEEVTEQAVLDATKGIVDTMSYLGLTKKQGTFGGWNNILSKQGFENYIANFIGGVLGGGLFEFQRSKIAPWLDPSMLTRDTQKSLYELVAGGHKDAVIDVINSKRKSFGNKYITMMNTDGTFEEANENSVSQADLIADKAIAMVNVIDGILNSNDLVHSDEDIVKKAIMDDIIISQLKKSITGDSKIGLEGLILEDYKEKMFKIGELESKIKNLTDSEDDKKLGKLYTQESKVYMNDINEILEGKFGSKYFGQAMLYLNKQVHSPFLKISKADYTKEKYKVDYLDLPETGLGLSKERIDKEWNDHISSMDLKKDLETAYKVYTNLEQILNAPIAAYAETGYDIVRKEALKNIIDLKSTIDLFNTEQDPVKKNQILERFVEINNTLENSKVVAPWTVLHNDMFEQLNNLGLIKKVEYSRDAEGNILESVSDFTPDDLNETFGENKVTAKDIMKNTVEQYFKQFPLNPLNAEAVIEKLNVQITRHNEKALNEIKKLQEKPDQTPEDLQKISELENSIYNFKVNSLMETSQVRELVTLAQNELNVELTNKGITLKQIEEYNRLKGSENFFKENFNDLLAEFNVESWMDLDLVGLNSFIDKLNKLGLDSLAIAKLEEISPNASQAILEIIAELENKEELSPEELLTFKVALEPFINTLINLVNDNHAILNNEEIIEANDLFNDINKKLQQKIEQAKPSILKLHNYALDLLTEALASGTADKEVFLEAEKLVKEEIIKVGSLIFPDASNLEFPQILKLLESIPLVIKNLLDEFNLSETGVDTSFTSSDTLESVIKAEEAQFALDPNYKGIFNDMETLLFMKNNYDGKLSLASINSALRSSLESAKLAEEDINRVNKFLELQLSGITLKSNPLYDFIRKFELTLNSNPNNKTAKIFEILEQEEVNLRSSSNVTNYLSDNIREQDLNQAISHLEMIKAVVNAMSTTQLSFGDPYGFIQSRINYAKKYNQEDDVLNLKTITSDLATLMAQDLEALITKLKFLKDLSIFNVGKRTVEQELIRSKVDEILISNWKQWIQKANLSFLPLEKINEILTSTESNAAKLMAIENAVFDHNVKQQEEALVDFLKHLENVDSDQFSQIDKDVTNIEAWDLAVYYATVLAMRAQDFNVRSYLTVNGEFKKAPFYTQELDARIIKASTVNPNLFAKLIELKSNTTKTVADFITIILGGAGTGKTSAVFGLDLENFRQTNEMTNIWLAAPTELQRDNLQVAINDSVGTNKLTTNKFTKLDLFEKLGIKNIALAIENEIQNINDDKVEKKYVELVDNIISLKKDFINSKWIESEIISNLSNLPNLLLIDEVTHFSSFELYLLNAISRFSYVNDNLNFMKIIAAGDPTQLGYLAKIDNDYYSYNVDATNAIFTPRLWASIRSANNQKRLNNDRYIRITRELTKIYKANGNDYDKSNNEALAYLETTKDLNTLSYRQSPSELAGDRIVTDLSKEIVDILKLKIGQKPETTIGILTSDGKLPEEWNKLLTDAGIITAENMDRIKLFTPKNVQGSEVDYFIFDANLITTFDKFRDNVKAFYTFMSRSKVASIIVDKDNVLEKFNIKNGKNDDYSIPFDPLTDQVITAAKTKRSEDLKALLKENMTPSNYDNFKWKTADEKENESEEITDSRFVPSEVPEVETIHTVNYSKEDKNQEEEKLKEDFKILMHSFYNNPNADIDSKTKKITVNEDNPPTDLNFSENVDPNEAQEVIESWMSLKYYLLNNPGVNSIISSEFQSYLEKVFVGDLYNTQKIKVEPVITVSKYSEYNTPYGKHGFDKDKILKNNELLINYSVKISLGQKVHYITLATFGTRDKILEQAKKYKAPLDKIIERFNSLESALGDKNFLVLKVDDVKNIEFLTSTRLEKVTTNAKSTTRKNFSLTSLREQFPGMKISEIRFFPQTIEAFETLMKSYTFGKERFTGDGITEKERAEKMKQLFEGYTDDKGNKKMGLKNRPYIVFSTANDLDGNLNDNTTQAVLIPIGSNQRKFDTVVKEVNDILKERKKDIEDNYQVGVQTKLSDKLNAKTEVLLNRSDILSVLIKWGQTKIDTGESLLDLLMKEIEFTISDTVTGNKTSVFDIFSRFNSKYSQISKERMKQVIVVLKGVLDTGNKNITDIKLKTITQLSRVTGWHWTFFNIFGYETIIDDVIHAEFADLASKGQIDDKAFEVFNESKGAIEMKEILKQLMDSIKGFNFYYSIPIKPAKVKGGAFLANSQVSGENGFSEDVFGDKFFIGVAPEGPRLLLNLNSFLSAEVIDDAKSEIIPEPIVEPEVVKAPKKAKVKGEPKVEPVVEPIVELVIEVNDNKDLINVINSKISDEELKINLKTVLEVASLKLGDNFRLRLEQLVNSEGFNNVTDGDKIVAIIDELGFAINDRNKTVVIQSIEIALGLDKVNDISLIKDLKQKINNLLKSCY